MGLLLVILFASLFRMQTDLAYTDFNTETKKTTDFSVQIQPQKEGFIVTTREPGIFRTTTYDTQGNLLIYSEKRGNKEAYYSRNGTTIAATAKEGTEVDDSIMICNDSPWIQELHVGLRPFVLSDKTQLKYVCINPDELELVDMVVTKKEMVVFEGKTAQKLYLTLQGWRSKFWDADLVVDTKTGLVLQMKAKDRPGKPLIITTLKQ